MKQTEQELLAKASEYTGRYPIITDATQCQSILWGAVEKTEKAITDGRVVIGATHYEINGHHYVIWGVRGIVDHSILWYKMHDLGEDGQMATEMTQYMGRKDVIKAINDI